MERNKGSEDKDLKIPATSLSPWFLLIFWRKESPVAAGFSASAPLFTVPQAKLVTLRVAELQRRNPVLCKGSPAINIQSEVWQSHSPTARSPHTHRHLRSFLPSAPRTPRGRLGKCAGRRPQRQCWAACCLGVDSPSAHTERSWWSLWKQEEQVGSKKLSSHHNTRTQGGPLVKMNVGRFSTNKRNNFFFTRHITKLWNFLPQEKKMATNLDAFKVGIGQIHGGE